ncbi:MAG TPA: GTPase ObgE [Candidatus Paceibacterota bacterium]|nr:GTPase ObgE [Candidatus Paceibacterota bacterium]
MSFVDELTILARAGRGGDGVERWLHEKGKEYSGPAGGNGGNGGDVYIEGVRDINLLARYRGEKKFEAGAGNPGENNNRTGAGGRDMVIALPIGSVVTNLETGEVHELLHEGERKLILKGGRGGAGNAAFKSSVNRTPTETLPGLPGEESELRIELRLIADAGLIGLPNAGKSSLLNALTGATAKVGSYAFTTLDPNLGMLYTYILADIPGLIEGAADGKGLGSKFLRHIARTKLLIHCVSLESEDPVADYRAVRGEIEAFEGGALADKPELVLFTKSDIRDAAYIEKVRKSFAKEFKKETAVVSVLDDAAVEALRQTLVAHLR